VTEGARFVCRRATCYAFAIEKVVENESALPNEWAVSSAVR